MKNLLLFVYLISLGCNLFGEEPPIEEKQDRLNELWRYSLNTAGDAPPTFAGDTLFFAAYPNLYAASSTDSLIFWESFIDDINEYEDQVFLIDPTQIVINQVNNIKAYSKQEGHLLWEYDTGEHYKINSNGKHEIHPNGYYFIARGGKLVEISKTGEHVSINDVDSAYGLSGVTYLNGVVYINAPNSVNGGFTRGLLLAQDYETREELWRYETDHCGFYEKPIIEQGIMYAASRGNSPECELVAIKIDDGSIIWQTVEKTIAYQLLLTPSSFIITTGGSLRSYSKSDGNLMWVYKWEGTVALIEPVYSNGYVYMSDHGSIYILDVTTGELVHKAASPGGFIWHFAVNEHRLFVQTDRQLVAYEPWHLREKNQ
jgi:outer membrane protein assembly factor BamB